MEGQMSLFDVDGWFGKTCAAHSPQIPARISESSLKKQRGLQTPMPLFLDLTESGRQADASWGRGILSLGESIMPASGAFRSEEDGYACLLTSTALQPLGYYLEANWSEHPSQDIVTKLSEILETAPDEKYRLSAAACNGILRRAERKGKGLPPELKAALERQAEVSP